MSKPVYDVEQRPPLSRWIPLSFQHVFAMFSATVLVPLLTGLNPAVALFTSGIGTLLYIVITRGKVPTYLGSSFAYIAPLIAVSASYGVEYALGAGFCVGLFYLLVAFIIRQAGTGWLDRMLPPVVIGSVIIVIGLKLAPTAMNMAMYPFADPSQGYNGGFALIAAVTLGIAIVSMIVLKGFFTVIPILIGIAGGYLFTLIMGSFLPAFSLIDFTPVSEASWFGFAKLVLPKFSLVPIVTFLLVSMATIAEHLGDTMVLSKVVGRDFYKNPGIHRTLAGDGAATALASLFGGPPNTTYGENIGAMAISRVYSVWVIGGAAVIAVLLSFIQKVGALIQTIPTPVMGGISMMLFGIIASAGIRTVVESGVDYTCKRNLTITSVILVIGIGGGKIFFPITEALNFELADVALATFVGIVLNLILPPSLNEVDEEQHVVDEAESLPEV
ncbi:solute carrier family 23 protein [Marispirochaeta aestuarii]|uniref:solute carrier family 23 protein n=1 Tax=Marispirochaeta aestuarii TaxID=1963862 RepID=UPI0029C96B7C|nr:solute carrier family 23 protein [Marispirochaeta aestuarii]